MIEMVFCLSLSRVAWTSAIDCFMCVKYTKCVHLLVVVASTLAKLNFVPIRQFVMLTIVSIRTEQSRAGQARPDPNQSYECIYNSRDIVLFKTTSKQAHTVCYTFI